MRTFQVWGIKVNDLLPEETHTVFNQHTAAQIYVGNFLEDYELTGHGYEYPVREVAGQLVRLWKFETVNQKIQMGAPVWVKEVGFKEV